MVFNPNLTIWLTLPNTRMNATLVPKHIYNPVGNIIMPYYVAVVLLSKGVVSSFSWQDGCGSCANGKCIDNSCGISQFSGSTDLCNGTVDCNVKVYLAWSGRDSNDDACKSISSTPDNFNKYSLTPSVNFGTSFYNDFIYQFSSTAPNPLPGHQTPTK